MKLLLFILLIPLFTYSKTQEYTGEAKFKGKVVYLEQHKVEIQDNKAIRSETIYKRPDGLIIGKLTNDYSKSVNVPEYLMEDMVTKNKHGIRHEDKKIFMFNQDDGKREETKEIAEDVTEGELLVAGQGLHYYLVSKMDEVVQKGKLTLKFMIPGQLDVYEFKLQVIKVMDTRVEFEVLINNWFLKLFAPKLKMIYDTKLRRLLSYEGLSNLKGVDGKLMKVEIKYDYK
jgi:hypothetical protein